MIVWAKADGRLPRPGHWVAEDGDAGGHRGGHLPAPPSRYTGAPWVRTVVTSASSTPHPFSVADAGSRWSRGQRTSEAAALAYGQVA